MPSSWQSHVYCVRQATALIWECLLLLQECLKELKAHLTNYAINKDSEKFTQAEASCSHQTPLRLNGVPAGCCRCRRIEAHFALVPGVAALHPRRRQDRRPLAQYRVSSDLPPFD